ncbi:MAG: hypothetical protein LBI05_09245 [Planctomycetaceae bacterium]|jgi:hypothetical protein|nr:hypothetical protein [Planctomycetaceae bacterium]
MQSESPSATRREFLHAKLDALLDESDLVADHAAYGETYKNIEKVFLVHGRKFLKETFQEQLQERIEHTEATDAAKQCPHCKKKRAIKTANPNT